MVGPDARIRGSNLCAERLCVRRNRIAATAVPKQSFLHRRGAEESHGLVRCKGPQRLFLVAILVKLHAAPDQARNSRSGRSTGHPASKCATRTVAGVRLVKADETLMDASPALATRLSISNCYIFCRQDHYVMTKERASGCQEMKIRPEIQDLACRAI